MAKKSSFIIKTRRLVIRPWTLADIVPMQRVINFRRVTKMTSSMPYPYTINDARFWIQKTRRYFRQRPIDHMHFAITLDDVVVGSIGADRDGDQAEIGYWLTPKLHGRGIMTEAVKSFSKFLFQYWPVIRLVGKTFVFNPASGRVLTKSGFRFTALEAPAILKDGKWRDANIYLRYRHGR